jgi:hypothetical protein
MANDRNSSLLHDDCYAKVEIVLPRWRDAFGIDHGMNLSDEGLAVASKILTP